MTKKPDAHSESVSALTFDTWVPGSDLENEDLIRARFPGELLRVSTNHFEPGADFVGTSRCGTLFVSAGRAQFSSKHGDAQLTAGTLMNFPGGDYGLKVLGETRCTIVKVWNLGELLAEQHHIAK